MHANFCMNFTQLLNNTTYTLPLSFVELCLKMTKLCCFIQFHPRRSPFLRVRASCRTGCKRTVLVYWNSPDLNPLDYHTWTVMSGVPFWKSTINSSQSLRRQMSWKSLHTIWEVLPQEHIKQGGDELHQVFDCLHGCGCHGGDFEHCSNSIHLQVCVLISSSLTNRFCFQSYQQTIPVKTMLRMQRNGGRFSWSSIILSFSDVFQQNFVVKCALYCLIVV